MPPVWLSGHAEALQSAEQAFTSGGLVATFEEAKQVKRKHSLRLLKTPGVCGVDVQSDAQGQGFICIHLDAEGAAAEAELAQDLDGVPVKLLYTGPFEKQT